MVERVEAMKLMNKSLDNNETIHKSTKERKNIEKHKRAKEYLRNTAHQKDHRVN
jgi:hypothetical protein